MTAQRMISIYQSFKPASPLMHYDGLPAKRTGGCGVRLMKALHQKRTNRKVGENDSDINRADHAAELALLGQFATKLGDAKVGENYARTA